MRSKREQGKIETRRKIFEAARAAFLEQGFEGTTMRDVAARAGVGLGTVNLHFRDKSSLLHEVFYGEIERKAFEAVAHVPDAPLEEQLVHLLNEEYRYYEEQRVALTHWVKESFFIAGHWGSRYEEQLWRYAGEVAKLFESARDRGEIKPETDCGVAAMSYISHYMIGLVMGVRKEPFNREEVMKTVEPMVRMLARGLRSKEARHES
ncbi:TetR/AcrR family transcriptional regulator [Salidesulfovibrio onnuriiensis]|uniref:TetR/AcrR family transcriptional regulator n=1 Tax=Salidesulfovibrio onnuriiensis TaxID=2583823 RepID=UPI00164FCEA9|nr:TetR/AcrR family transcriptional regulator [Salidesulfovibrio onnuriiensis]